MPSSANEASEDVKDQLGEIYTPGRPIIDTRLFSGRGELLERINDERHSGKHFIIYGPRQVGKSSFSHAAFPDAYRHVCSRTSDFVSIFLAVLLEVNDAFTESERTELGHVGTSVGGGHLPVSGETFREAGVTNVVLAGQPLDVNLFVRRILDHEDEIGTIVLEEFDKLQAAVRTQVVDVMRALSDRNSSVTIVLVGIGKSPVDLIPNADREWIGHTTIYLKVPPMDDCELSDIFLRRKELFRIEMPKDVQDTIRWISCRYPTSLHQIALYSCLAAWTRVMARVIGDWATRVSKDTRPWWSISKYFAPIQIETMPRVKDLGLSVGQNDLGAAVRLFVNGIEGNFPEEIGEWRRADDADREFLMEYASQRDSAWDEDQDTNLSTKFPFLFEQSRNTVTPTFLALFPFLRAQRYLSNERVRSEADATSSKEGPDLSP